MNSTYITMFFQLAVVLFFPKFVYMQEEASCYCGKSSKQDCIEAKDVKTSIKKHRPQFKDNYQYCYQYRLLEGINCNTATLAISEETYPSSPLEIEIQSAEIRIYRTATPKLSEGKCYPPQIYCIASINCGGDNLFTIEVTSSGSSKESLTTSKNMKPCKDRFTYFEFNNHSPVADPDPDAASFCGKNIGSPLDMAEGITIIPRSKVDLHFFSSQCCQNCGKSLQFACHPIPILPSSSGPIHPSQRQLYKKLFLDVWNKWLFYRVRTAYIVIGGSILIFDSQTITITSSNSPDIKINGIYHLLVFDEASVCYYSFWRSSRRIFNSGILYIGYYNAWYIATENESPIERRTNEEKAFVQRAVTFVESFYNKDPEIIYLNDAEVIKLGFKPDEDYKPDCAKCNDPDCAKCNDPDCAKCNDPDCAKCHCNDPDSRPRSCIQSAPCLNKDAQTQFLSDAKFYKRTSDDSLVNAYANLVINTLAFKTDNNNRGSRPRYNTPFGLPGTSPVPSEKLTCRVLI